MGSIFCRKSQRIQRATNEFLQNVIKQAEKRAGSPQERSSNNYLDRREQENSARRTQEEYSNSKNGNNEIGPETDVNDGNCIHLFRSNSITTEDFKRDQGYFIPDEDTEDILRTCFPDLFTENGGTESIPKHQCQREIQKRYGQLFDYFGEVSVEGRTIKRSVMRKHFCFYSENWMSNNNSVRSECVRYMLEVPHYTFYHHKLT